MRTVATTVVSKVNISGKADRLRRANSTHKGAKEQSPAQGSLSKKR